MTYTNSVLTYKKLLIQINDTSKLSGVSEGGVKGTSNICDTNPISFIISSQKPY